MPNVVAELGPGDSIGIGLAALLTGVEKYYALDLVRYFDLTSSLAVLDELVSLFKGKESIPDDSEFPSLNPKLESYAFPDDLLSDELLMHTLSPRRIANIQRSMARADETNSRIVYHAPWTDAAVIQERSVDMIYSQAVLEHVDDLFGAYESMQRWLKPGGVMSHQVDFRCHRKADTWNGHWTYSDLAWRVVVGRRPYLLNRQPHSEHVRLLRRAGFEIVVDKSVTSPSTLRPTQLARKFRDMSEKDLTTSGAFIVAVAPESDQIATHTR